MANLQEIVAAPRETLDIEVKGWLDLSDKNVRAGLAKELIALANHGGGYLLAGFKEADDGTFTEGDNPPPNLNAWSQDEIQDVVEKYIHPSIQLNVDHLQRGQSSQKFPIIAVPGGHRVPIKARAASPDGKKLAQNRVYIRRPGPKSEEPQTAEEWNLLFERCIQNRQGELLDAMRSIMSGVLPGSIAKQSTKQDELKAFSEDAQEKWAELVKPLPQESNARFLHGYYDVAFAIDGVFEKPSLRDLRDIIHMQVRSYSGWPPFLTIDVREQSPRPVDGAVQTWLQPDNSFLQGASYHDFWRISPEGLFYQRSGYFEDSRQGVVPGTVLSAMWTIKRLAEATMEAAHIANALGAHDASLICKFDWKGLRGRSLIRHEMIPYGVQGGNTCSQDSFSASEAIKVSTVKTFLPELAYKIVTPLFELFNFARVDKRYVDVYVTELLAKTI